MTDEQVIKAIECCIQQDGNTCGDCPFYDKQEGCVDSDFKLLSYALDLIKRQQARIEQEVDLNREMFEKMARDEAEIEMLKEIANPKCQQCVEQTRKNSMVEFADELKHRTIYWSYDFQYNSEYIAAVREIDDIVKEMTEGKDDEQVD